MAKFRHGLPVSSALMVGWLEGNQNVPQEELANLALVMVLCEEGGQKFSHVCEKLNYDPRPTVAKFAMQDEVTAPEIWGWRLAGFEILKATFRGLLPKLQEQAAQPRSRMEAGRLAFQDTIIVEAFKKKIEKENQLLLDSARQALTS